MEEQLEEVMQRLFTAITVPMEDLADLIDMVAGKVAENRAEQNTLAARVNKLEEAKLMKQKEVTVLTLRIEQLERAVLRVAANQVPLGDEGYE
jgi:polyhydroxyalkanoate synthesis regulator phasin